MMRNLLGRLNARTSDDLVRIAQFWQIPLPGNDRGRHIGTIYRVMTDIRAARTAWSQLDARARDIVYNLAMSESGPLTIAQIADQIGVSEQAAREAAIRLFRWGLLAREGDSQELPVGAAPRLFLPRELGQGFRRVQDEMDAGDLSDNSLRVLLEVRDDPEIEETAGVWGIKVIPGLRRRHELVGEILRHVSSPGRIARVVATLHAPAKQLWEVVRQAAPDGPLPLDDAVAEAGLAVPELSHPDHITAGSRLRDALIELETSLLVMHTYRRDGSRALFVPQEILHPGKVATAIPLRPLQPLNPDLNPEPEPMHPFTLAWDVLTVVREISGKGAPVWVPGEPLSRTWQRQMNSRLWYGGEDIPPEGYLGFVLYLALGVGVVEPGPHTPATGADKHAVRPVPSSRVRHWRSRSFAQQTAELRDVWLHADQWVEGREREQIDVWGADWQGFRRRLLAALGEIGEGEWLLVTDVARRVAEQDPGLIGSTFTAASARGGGDRGDARTLAIAQIAEIELQTAMFWLGFVELARVDRQGLALRVTDAARLAAADARAVPEVHAPADGEPVLTLDARGLVTLLHPSPLHIWSLSAFADAEALRPNATFQLRPGSVGRALGAGFDLEQITEYLERQCAKPVPTEVLHLLREWTAGFRRVRLRRATLLTPDFDTGVEELRAVVEKAGLEVVEGVDAVHGGVIVLLPATGDDASTAEHALLAALRAAGHAGQWATPGAETPPEKPAKRAGKKR
jgi:hypothetical protein